MGMEMLKIFAIEIEKTKFIGRDTLIIFNPFYYKDKMTETKTDLYISIDKRDRKYKYILNVIYFKASSSQFLEKVYNFDFEVDNLWFNFFHQK